MARVKIRYFVEKPGATGARYFWQPTAALRAAGFQAERLPDLRTAAIARAEALNAELDAWRTGTPLPAGAASRAPRSEVQPKTLSAVIAAYKRHRLFTTKAAKTQRAYLQNIAVLEKWGGDIRVAAITGETVETLYCALYARTPAKAKAVVTMLRILLRIAQDSGLVTVNAAAQKGLVGAKPSGRLWPRAAVEAFIEAADAAGWHSIGTAVRLNHWIGQREADILSLPRSAVAGGRITVTQHKTGARVSIPDNPAVRARILAELARQDERARLAAAAGATLLPPATLLVCETTGKPWKEDYFRHVFADIRAALAKENPTFAHPDGSAEETRKLLMMHLRHTAITELAHAGCTPGQIAGISGHTLNSINRVLEHYLVRTSELATQATQLRLAYDQRQAGFAPRPGSAT